MTSPASVNALKAPRVLLVEDSFMAARSLATMLTDLGAEVLGPVPTVEAAMALLDARACDGAVLDVDLGSETSEVIARRLERLRIPFFFVTDQESPRFMIVNELFQRRCLIRKPIEPAMFEQVFNQQFRAQPTG